MTLTEAREELRRQGHTEKQVDQIIALLPDDRDLDYRDLNRALQKWHTPD